MAFRVRRGYFGDVTGMRKGAEYYAHYTFEIDFFKFKWELNQNRGEEFAQWAQDIVEGQIEATLKSDADKLDVPLGLLKDTCNFELQGLGTRDTKSDGTPDWENPTSVPFFSMERNYDGEHNGLDQLKSVMRFVGDNYVAKLFEGTGLVRTGSDPIYFIPKKLVWRVSTADLGVLGATAQEFFIEKQNEKTEEIIRKAAATKAKNLRSASAKKGWETRRLKLLIEFFVAEEKAVKNLRRRTSKESKRLLLMHEQLLRLAGMGTDDATARIRRPKQRSKPKATKAKGHSRRRNNRPRRK